MIFSEVDRANSEIQMAPLEAGAFGVSEIGDRTRMLSDPWVINLLMETCPPLFIHRDEGSRSLRVYIN